MSSLSPLRPFLRPLSLIAVLALGAWVLWPPARSEKSVSASTSAGAGRRAKYVIRFAPGATYFPGTLPQGIGEPLQGLSKVVAAFEARFPDTRVEIINAPMLREFLVTQLSGGSAPDIVMVNVEDVWVDTQKDWYVPLDRYLEAPNPFVAARDPAAPGAKQWWDMFRYQAISRGKKGPDGRNYCISLDMVETGIFYNRTYFSAHGLKVPATWGEFLATCARIRNAGKTPLALNLDMLADWGQDLVFDQLYQGILPGIDLKKDPERDAYQPAYLDPDEIAFLYRKGLFTRRDPRYVEVWRHVHELAPYITRDLIAADPVRDFVNQESVMLWNGSWFVDRLTNDHRLGFDWDVFYLPPITRQESRYAIGAPMCVIGGSGTQWEITNSAVSDTDPSRPFAERMAQSGRLQRTLQLLQFICLPENTASIVNEYPGFIPNIVGVPALPVLAPFERILERRYTSTKWAFTFDLRFNDITRRMLLLFLNNGIDLDGFLAWQDSNLQAATSNLIARKHPDFASLEHEWRRLAPVRARYADLPEPTP